MCTHFCTMYYRGTKSSTVALVSRKCMHSTGVPERVPQQPNPAGTATGAYLRGIRPSGGDGRAWQLDPAVLCDLEQHIRSRSLFPYRCTRRWIGTLTARRATCRWGGASATGCRFSLPEVGAASV